MKILNKKVEKYVEKRLFVVNVKGDTLSKRCLQRQDVTAIEVGDILYYATEQTSKNTFIFVLDEYKFNEHVYPKSKGKRGVGYPDLLADSLESKYGKALSLIISAVDNGFVGLSYTDLSFYENVKDIKMFIKTMKYIAQNYNQYVDYEKAIKYLNKKVEEYEKDE